MIDINFDFTTDTPQFWDSYWNKDNLLGYSSHDPDIESKTLQLYQKLLYSKQLPNGSYMRLTEGVGANYLTWDNFRFGSDVIITSFRFVRNRNMIEQVANAIDDWHSYIEGYMRKSYTIGGEIIFPKMRGSINQSRGCNPYIKDRWDLTLECIRRFYRNENSPLYDTLIRNKQFFDLFVDFKGYVDFFYLQDCVSADYNSVNFWLGDGNFEINPLPKTVTDYLTYIENELIFVENRNNRIKFSKSLI